MKQLDSSTMSNNVSYKNSRLMATIPGGSSTTTAGLNKARTIESIFLESVAKRNQTKASIKDSINESYARQQLERAKQQFGQTHKTSLRPHSFDVKLVNIVLEQ